ncbi:MAG: Crp/Fnr family transcriptional regulator [Novosphingobium sp.]|nr:Crp/Fnr family transcriptional regulator [Novosphingobium sp.]
MSRFRPSLVREVPQEPFPTKNLLLSALGADDLALLAPSLKRVRLHREQQLIGPGERIDEVHFLEGGVGSVTAGGGETQTEIGVIGSEGMTGVPLLLGSDRSLHKTFMQIDGGTALTLGAAPLADAMRRSESLRAHLLRYAHCYMIQLASGSVANARYRMEARLARWLLMCHDRMPDDDIPLTHEFMSLMIAAQRSGVTITLHVLEGAGMIRSTRGLVTILDRAKLEELAEETYGESESEYRRLIAPFGKPAGGHAEHAREAQAAN